PGAAAGSLPGHGQGAGVRPDRRDRRVVQGHERRWWPEGRRRRGQRVGRRDVHAPVRRQLRDERDLFPARPAEDRIATPWRTWEGSTKSPSAPCKTWRGG